MEKTFYIKNMVCDRCKSSITQIVKHHQAQIIDLQLGRVVLKHNENFDTEKFAAQLLQQGFEMIRDPEIQLGESIKITLLELIEKEDFSINISTFLSDKLHRDYSVLSRLFKKIYGETLEKYFIKLKIEKVKELIQMQNISFSEIAYQLGYNSISHLSGQFKNITGMTMSEYKSSQDWNRLPLDKIL